MTEPVERKSKLMRWFMILIGVVGLYAALWYGVCEYVRFAFWKRFEKQQIWIWKNLTSQSKEVFSKVKYEDVSVVGFPGMPKVRVNGLSLNPELFPGVKKSQGSVLFPIDFFKGTFSSQGKMTVLLLKADYARCQWNANHVLGSPFPEILDFKMESKFEGCDITVEAQEKEKFF